VGSDLIVEISPFSVGGFDQGDFAVSSPALDVLLALNRAEGIVEDLGVDETIDVVFGREAAEGFMTVSPDALLERGR
jgi:hypothetical protein